MNKAIIGLAWALCASIAFSVSAHARSVSSPSTPAFAQVSASTNVQPTVNWTVDGQSLKSKPLVAGDSYQPIATFYGDNPSSVDASFRYIYVYSRGLTNVWVDAGGGGNATFPLLGYDNWCVAYLGDSHVIPAGKTATVTIRGDIDPNASEVYAIVFDGTNFPSQNPKADPVVDYIPQEGISNMSVRTKITPDSPTIVGFVVTGDSAHSYPVLVRCAGPALKKFGLTGTLDDPSMQVYDSNGFAVWSGNNDDWNWQMAGWAFSQVGAFSFDVGSKDSAVVVWLQPGSYTVQVKGFGTGTGTALVEAYQLPIVRGGKG